MSPESSTPVIRRRFVKVAARRVHYLRAGAGPPAVLVHSSPANARILLPEIAWLSRSHTCFAFDTPGFGLSDALPLAHMEVTDLADALADTLRTVGLPPCPVFGSHTGAAVTLELAARHPHRVTGIVLDGLPIFTEDECATLFSGGYFRPMPIDPLGGHFASAWTRFRDQSIWFPWFDQRPDNLNPYDLSPPARTHAWLMMYFYAAGTYMPAYRAALAYGERALVAVAALTTRAVFTATETDMLHPHLGRLPTLKPGQEIRGIGTSIERKHLLIAESFVSFGSAGMAPADPHEIVSSAMVERQFVDAPHGSIHVRHAGDRSLPPMLLLHDAPGSAQFLEPLIAALSARYFVCAPDLPGCGESDPLPGDAPAMADYVAAMMALCASAGLSRPLVYGIGFGSSLAIALAAHASTTAYGLVLRGVLMPDGAENAILRREYAPPIVIEPDGSHWYRTWLMLRDAQIYWPWCDRRQQALRRVPADFGAEHMHAWTFEVMKQHASYQHLIQAAIGYDAGAALAAVAGPVLICNDASTPLSVYDHRLEALLPNAPRCEATDDVAHTHTIAEYIGGT